MFAWRVARPVGERVRAVLVDYWLNSFLYRADEFGTVTE
jgi:hypothetical protein